MAAVMVKGGKGRDLGVKAFPFCTAEAQQDSPHFPACVSEGLCKAASPEGPLHPDCSASQRERQPSWLLGSLGGHCDSGKVKLPTTDIVEAKPEHCHQNR